MQKLTYMINSTPRENTAICHPTTGILNAKPLKTLQAEFKRAQKLAQELNPYLPISKKNKKELEKLNIFSDDPFVITNQLLLVLEESLEELSKRDIKK